METAETFGSPPKISRWDPTRRDGAESGPEWTFQDTWNWIQRERGDGPSHREKRLYNLLLGFRMPGRTPEPNADEGPHESGSSGSRREGPGSPRLNRAAGVEANDALFDPLGKAWHEDGHVSQTAQVTTEAEGDEPRSAATRGYNSQGGFR